MSFKERYLNRHIFFEAAPALVFFAVNAVFGLMTATAALAVATVLFTVSGMIVEGRVPVFPVISLALVLALGGATLYFDDETFVKIKPTVGSTLFALILLAGLNLRRGLLPRALEGQVWLTEEGWRVLTLRWVALALAMAILNELTWRNVGTDTWVAVKTVLTPVSIGCYILVTRFTAPRYWNPPTDTG